MGTKYTVAQVFTSLRPLTNQHLRWTLPYANLLQAELAANINGPNFLEPIEEPAQLHGRSIAKLSTELLKFSSASLNDLVFFHSSYHHCQESPPSINPIGA